MFQQCGEAVRCSSWSYHIFRFQRGPTRERELGDADADDSHLGNIDLGSVGHIQRHGAVPEQLVE